MSNDTEWRIRTANRGFDVCYQTLIFRLGCLFTGFIAYPWLANWYFGKWAGRLVLGGRTVRYTGSAGGILAMWLKVWLLSVLTLTIYWWISGRKAVDQYMDSHVEWA